MFSSPSPETWIINYNKFYNIINYKLWITHFSSHISSYSWFIESNDVIVNGDIYLFVVKDFQWLFAVRYTTNTNILIYVHPHATKLVSSYDRTFLSSSDRGKIGFQLDLSLFDQPDGK